LLKIYKEIILTVTLFTMLIVFRFTSLNSNIDFVSITLFVIVLSLSYVSSFISFFLFGIAQEISFVIQGMPFSFNYLLNIYIGLALCYIFMVGIKLIFRKNALLAYPIVYVGNKWLFAFGQDLRILLNGGIAYHIATEQWIWMKILNSLPSQIIVGLFIGFIYLYKIFMKTKYNYNGGLALA
jgi:hypothetical protein